MSGAASAPRTPPARSDARRNRERLLDAARALFNEVGVEQASMNDVARRAGVGPGTLWRHFPNRDALVAAVVGDSLDGLVRLADELLGSLPPGEALARWTAALVGHITRYRGLATMVMHAAAEGDGPLGTHCREAERSAAEMVERARQAGQVRNDLAVAELIRLATAVAVAGEPATGPIPAERLLTLVFDGLRGSVNPARGRESH
ncbi:TetR/AcrR family transcriptional regulator [Amycolatopsis aidingensis]|uniref:TetR/AcrR family transcriptional regulator n=1 Tax=Amycolatopsis aidingensis TaxID=2842453 RepID=UPI0022B63430|nr:TetR/AcrR family transcriptional regulator [Amycolatopsis aidingensis]